jgi:hypothetical protein
MKQRQEPVDPIRLCDAATAVLHALAEVAERRGEPWPYEAPAASAAKQPPCLSDFTRREIEEATAFLIRLGILETPRADGAR